MTQVNGHKLESVRMRDCVTHCEQHGSVFLQAGGLDPSGPVGSPPLELR